MPILTMDVESFTVGTTQSGVSSSGSWRYVTMASPDLSHGIHNRAKSISSTVPPYSALRPTSISQITTASRHTRTVVRKTSPSGTACSVTRLISSSVTRIRGLITTRISQIGTSPGCSSIRDSRSPRARGPRICRPAFFRRTCSRRCERTRAPRRALTQPADRTNLSGPITGAAHSDVDESW